MLFLFLIKFTRGEQSALREALYFVRGQIKEKVIADEDQEFCFRPFRCKLFCSYFEYKKTAFSLSLCIIFDVSIANTAFMIRLNENCLLYHSEEPPAIDLSFK